MYQIIYKKDWVLINAFFFSFWMKRTEFDKYNYVKGRYNHLLVN
jgi:hypothetical protein